MNLSIDLIRGSLRVLNGIAAHRWARQLHTNRTVQLGDSSWTSRNIFEKKESPIFPDTEALIETELESFPAVLREGIFNAQNLKLALIAAGDFKSLFIQRHEVNVDHVAERMHDIAFHNGLLPKGPDFNKPYNNLGLDIKEIYRSFARIAIEVLRLPD